MDVSIIVVTYNSWELLIPCLRSIVSKRHGVEYEIVVVDNGSSNDNSQMIQIEFPSVKFVRNEGINGFSKGVNDGFRESTGRNVLILEPDTELVTEDGLKTLSDFLDSRETAAAVGPQLLIARSGDIQRSAFISFPTPLTLFMEWSALNVLLGWLFPTFDYPGKYYHTREQLKNIRKVAWVMGGIMMVKREAVRNIGLMDEQFFLLGEDAEWLWRMNQAGREIWYCPQAQFFHHWGVNLIDTKRTIQWYDSGMTIFFRKHSSKFFLPSFYPVTLIASIISLVVLTLGSFVMKSKRSELISQRTFNIEWIKHCLLNRFLRIQIVCT